MVNLSIVMSIVLLLNSYSAAADNNFEVRLVNGSTENEGAVEMFYNGFWGTICDNVNTWSEVEARVICKELGFDSSGAVPKRNSYYGSRSQHVFLDKVDCVGNERNISRCQHSPWGKVHSGCKSHRYDVGVFCQPLVKLTGSKAPTEGRVDSWYNNTWNHVCGDNFGQKEAEVVCRQNGFNTSDAIAKNIPTINRNVPILLKDINCTGSELSLAKCKHNGWINTDCDNMVEVVCPSADNNFEVRLVNGRTENEGAVEVFFNGYSGTICDYRNTWHAVEARVICKELGFDSSGAVPKRSSYYGSGSQQVVLDKVDCVGNERHISRCQHSPWGKVYSGCKSHRYDVSVFCQPLVKLTGGKTPTEGRVDSWYNNTWNPVCGDNFGQKEAEVVCRQNGFNTSGAIAKNIPTINRNEPILLKGINCTGSELSLAKCKHNGWINTDCDNMVEVVCPSYSYTIRLVGGELEGDGREEIFYNNTWRKVCHPYRYSKYASVICQQLGFSPSKALSKENTYFGTGTAQVGLEDLQCTGTEKNIGDCKHRPLDVAAYTHCYNRGVKCQPLVKLTGGNTPTEGRVDSWYNNTWNHVCGDNFGQKEAEVVCRQNGFNTSGAVSTNESTKGTIQLKDVNCTSSEQTIAECENGGWEQRDCNSTVYVKCSSYSYKVKLLGGEIKSEGRVEVLYNEMWGKTCDNRINYYYYPSVICRQLGFDPSGATAKRSSYFGRGPTKTWLDKVECTGPEKNIGDCRHRPWNVTAQFSCISNVGVICKPLVKLTGGKAPTEGRVDSWYNNTWNPVCGGNFGQKEAEVVCRQNGFNTSGAAVSTTESTKGTIQLKDVNCTSSEQTIAECENDGWEQTDCNSTVYVKCPAYSYTVKLLGGEIKSEGRVEVFYNEMWGTTCSITNNHYSSVICRQLGFDPSGATYKHISYFGRGPTKTWLDEVECTGPEKNIGDCRHRPWSVTATLNCNNIGVICKPLVKLTGGRTPIEGRVDSWYNNTWNPVCGGNFGQKEAEVVCRQIGFNTSGAMVKKNSNVARILLFNNIACNGSESTLAECQHEGLMHADCDTEVIVSCSAYNYPVRLVDGPNESEGRVEVFYNKTWGTISSNEFSNNAASVICRQIGFNPNGAVYKYNSFYGRGTGKGWLDRLECTGQEINIDFCRHRPWGLVTTHSYYQNTGVICQPYEITVLVSNLLQEDGQFKFQFQCNWDAPLEVDLWYTVSWYINNELFLTFPTSNKTSNISEETTLHEDMLKSKTLGFKIACGYTTSNAKDSPKNPLRKGLSKFIGIQILTPNILVSDGNRAEIIIRSTVPIGCPFNNPHCGLKINIDSPQNTSTDPCEPSSLFSNCGMLVDGSDWNQQFTMEVGLDTPTKYGKKNFINVINLKTTDTFSSHLIWQNYHIGNITIRSGYDTTKIEGKSCHAVGDPRMQTFNGRNYDNQNGGLYTLYENKAYKQEIQIKTESCFNSFNTITGWNTGPTCVCGVAVRVGREVFVMDHCEPLQYWSIGYTQCSDTQHGLMDITRSGSKYNIRLPSGTTLQTDVYNSSRFLNVYLYPSEADVLAGGLCGTLYDYRYITRENTASSTAQEFSESWRVTRGTDIFTDEITSLESIAKSGNGRALMCQCTTPPGEAESVLTCNRKHENCSVNIGNYQPISKCVVGKRFKRSAPSHPTQKISDINRLSKRSVSVDLPTWRNGWTSQKATDYCNNLFDNSSFVQKCLTVPNINTANSKKICIMDIELMGDTSFAVAAIETIMNKCVHEVSYETTLHVVQSGQQMSVLDQIKVVACPSDCFLQGTCKQGICECNDGFSGDDCATNIQTPPILGHFTNNGYCDLQENCTEVSAFGGIFTEGVVCKIKRSYLYENGELEENGETNVKAKVESISEIKCPLVSSRANRMTASKPEKGFAEVVDISVSNDGIHFSNTSNVIVLNSNCQTCRRTDDGVQCTIKDVFCVSGGECYAHGEPHLLSIEYKCSTDGNTRSWIKSATSDESEINGIIIAVGFVAGFLLCIVVIVFVSIKTQLIRKKKNVPANITGSNVLN